MKSFNHEEILPVTSENFHMAMWSNAVWQHADNCCTSNVFAEFKLYCVQWKNKWLTSSRSFLNSAKSKWQVCRTLQTVDLRRICFEKFEDLWRVSSWSLNAVNLHIILIFNNMKTSNKTYLNTYSHSYKDKALWNLIVMSGCSLWLFCSLLFRRNSYTYRPYWHRLTLIKITLFLEISSTIFFNTYITADLSWRHVYIFFFMWRLLSQPTNTAKDSRENMNLDVVKCKFLKEMHLNSDVTTYRLQWVEWQLPAFVSYQKLCNFFESNMQQLEQLQRGQIIQDQTTGSSVKKNQKVTDIRLANISNRHET